MVSAILGALVAVLSVVATFCAGMAMMFSHEPTEEQQDDAG